VNTVSGAIDVIPGRMHVNKKIAFTLHLESFLINGTNKRERNFRAVMARFGKAALTPEFSSFSKR
jgi:hypothetical protein